MKFISQPISVIKMFSFAGAASLAVTSVGHAAFFNLPSPTLETPGVALDTNTAGLTGTVLEVLDSPFVDNAIPNAFASGILRTLVVDRDPTAGVALDFYYQLINTSVGPDPFGDADFYRLKTTGGFDTSLAVTVAQTNSLAGLTPGVGSGFLPGNYASGASLKPAATADRDVGTVGSVGFDFPIQPPIPFTGNADNIGFGQTSSYLVVSTNSSVYGRVESRVSGSATSFPTTFAAIPEPGSILFGIAVIGTCLGRRARGTRRVKSNP